VDEDRPHLLERCLNKNVEPVMFKGVQKVAKEPAPLLRSPHVLDDRDGSFDRYLRAWLPSV
jgi:hypothetical protein